MEFNIFSRLLVACLFISLGIGTEAKPLRAPDVSKCPKISNCCIRPSAKVVDFKLPPVQRPLRVRRSAHLVDEEYKRKYANATRLMRQLPAEHPWNFMRQAAIHCAYADQKLLQMNHIKPFLVHGSWLFFPFHRAYLYFYERILGKLIGDDTFALPFWNWDNPAAMTVPLMYIEDDNSPLSDNTRYSGIEPPSIVEYGSGIVGAPHKPGVIINTNKETLYNEFVAFYTKVEDFMGRSYREGDDEPGTPGFFESGAHGAVHTWIGENMASLKTAAKDPMFYVHHANVDRLWEVWRDHLHRGIRKEISDPDWLNSTFVFWDENLQLVHIRVRDVLDIERLGYTYEKTPLPWLNESSVIMRQIDVSSLDAQATLSTQHVFPLILGNSTIRIPLVRKYNVFDQFERCTEKEEAILVKGIKLNTSESVWFDVYVSVHPTNRLTTDISTDAIVKLPSIWAGSFMRVLPGPTGIVKQHQLVIKLHDLLVKLGAERKNMILVTLAPRKMTTEVEIESVEISCML